MASFYGCSNFFGKYLPLLGFQDSTNILDNKELFVVPNKDAFQKVRIRLNSKVVLLNVEKKLYKNVFLLYRSIHFTKSYFLTY